ncbi:MULTISPECIES: LysR substrate-binding domain-containing protein [Ramlibacter]|uniref:LysR family transcriptional regulator n=1 Tax=Ramlibacter pinisoli TaxID=2682844 RepID=A0A6N8ITS5_9BURK|nr:MULTISPECIES: LysR substrate-binding domain-containing protein [Ramlibacter]MBA2965147.1 LysR family transcriptional regulator [Ramlibacter sp. CGMCC 1.13660]MVQ30112.1 LysR family transcriptional regulator [Ramlibacter pinisoli]
MRYDLTDLQLFVNVIDAGTISGGAKATFLTPASASERIKGMEDALGGRLMVRGKKGVSLTDAGTAVLRHARAILQQMQQMQGELQDLGGGAKARVRLLCNTSAVSEHLPRLVANFLRSHRAISIDLEEGTSQQIADAIRDEVCDLGVLSDAADTAGLECHQFRPDPLVLVLPDGHDLAGRRAISLAELPDSEFVGLADDIALQQLITRQMKRSGRRVIYRVRVRSLENVCAVVGQGIGVGIVPAAVAQRERRSAGIRCVRLLDSWTQRSLLVCMRKREELPAHAEKLLAYLLRQKQGKEETADGKLRPRSMTAMSP